ncbi:MAG: ARPP-1 family domain-containing protein [Terriglobia bacterium]
MRKDSIMTGLLLLVLGSPLVARVIFPHPVAVPKGAGVGEFRESWKVLEAITRRNLSIYPVVSSLGADTSTFLTLDEGVASGVVKILERGQLQGAIYRRRETRRWPPQGDQYPQSGSASVNELVLVNESSRPLLLLAGEVVSGGKQNRIIGADLLVPPKSEPVPLTVFCVEHGRWTAGGGGFGSAKAIAHPQIRMEAQGNKSQQGVWDSVSRAAGVLAAASPTQDYNQVLENPEVKRRIETTAQSIQADYERELREQIRGRSAVGVIVAINGEIVWTDVFPTPDLFRRYWPKLLRSYVMEAESRVNAERDYAWGRKLANPPTVKQAENFLLEDRGRVSVKVEPAVFRRTEVTYSEYQIVALEAIEKPDPSATEGVMLHYNKMARG